MYDVTLNFTEYPSVYVTLPFVPYPGLSLYLSVSPTNCTITSVAWCVQSNSFYCEVGV